MRKRGIIFLLLFMIFFPLISADSNYGEGIYGDGPYGGEVVIVPPTSSTGGSSSCSYDWICTNWFPTECPVTEMQERLCVNKGTCSGTYEMPDQKRNCTYEKKEPLFDIFLTLPTSENICPGDTVGANVKLENYGKIELLDAFMTYWIIDKNNSLIAELKDTRSVIDKKNFDISMTIPPSIPSGTYRLYAQITYSGNKTAIAGQSFEIGGENYCKNRFLNYIPLILIGFIFLIFVIIIILFKKIYSQKRLGKEKKNILDKQEKPIEKRIPLKISTENQKENLPYLKKKMELEEEWRRKKIEELKEKIKNYKLNKHKKTK